VAVLPIPGPGPTRVGTAGGGATPVLCPRPRPCCDVVVHIIIVGCGRVGSELAVTLAPTTEVVVIDREPKSFRRLPEDWGGRTVVGLGFDRDTLAEAEVGRADALAAVTSGDNSNILTARIAREHFEVPNVVARIYDPRRALMYQRLGIPTVATVTWTVDQVIRRLLPDTPSTEWTHPGGQVVLVERSLPTAWVGRTLENIDVGGRCRLSSVGRSGQGLVAGPGLIGQEGDILFIMARTDFIPAMDDRLRSEK
jgi:trk system potassium uptake protein TrkA